MTHQPWPKRPTPKIGWNDPVEMTQGQNNPKWAGQAEGSGNLVSEGNSPQWHFIANKAQYLEILFSGNKK